MYHFPSPTYYLIYNFIAHIIITYFKLSNFMIIYYHDVCMGTVWLSEYRLVVIYTNYTFSFCRSPGGRLTPLYLNALWQCTYATIRILYYIICYEIPTPSYYYYTTERNFLASVCETTILYKKENICRKQRDEDHL